MTRPLSDDLRRRVVRAVDDGMSRRGAAKRFGIAPSTAIKWVRAWQRTGCYRPRSQGGDRRSHRIEAQGCGGPGAGRRDPGHDPGGDRSSSGERARGADREEAAPAHAHGPVGRPCVRRYRPAPPSSLCPGRRPERLCCKPDVGVSQIRTTTVLSSCFCVGQTVL